MVGARSSDLALYRRVLLETSRAYWPHLVAIVALSLLSTPIALVLPLPVQIVVDSVIGTHPAPGVVRGIVPASMQTPGGLLVVACVLLVVATLLQQAEGFGSWM